MNGYTELTSQVQDLSGIMDLQDKMYVTCPERKRHISQFFNQTSIHMHASHAQDKPRPAKN